MKFEKFTFFPDIDLYFDRDMYDAKLLIDNIINHDLEYLKFALCINNPINRDQTAVEKWIDNKDNAKQQDLYDIFEERRLSSDQAYEFLEYAKSTGLKLIASVYDEKAVEICSNYVEALKISSSNITNFFLIDKVIQTGKSIIIDTGKSDVLEIEDTINFINSYGKTNHILLQHSPNRPPALSIDWALSGLALLKKKFNLPIGLSEHSNEFTQTVCAISSGVINIEKGIMLDKIHQRGVSDSAHALPISRLKEYLDIINETREAFLKEWHDLKDADFEMRKYSRSGLYAAKDLSKGETYSIENINVLAPEIGISGAEYYNVIGKKVTRDIKKGEPLRNENIGD